MGKKRLHYVNAYDTIVLQQVKNAGGITMRKNENLMRSCGTCEYCEVGCEENCPFELERETVKRPTLRGRRRNMKAEKAGAYAKAMQKLNSAENKATKLGYKKPLGKRNDDLKKEIANQEDVHEGKMGDPSEAYPKAVFSARANAIKQAERLARRQEKNNKK